MLICRGGCSHVKTQQILEFDAFRLRQLSQTLQQRRLGVTFAPLDLRGDAHLELLAGDN